MIMVGFMPELLAWDSLRQLMLLLDKAVEVRFCYTYSPTWIDLSNPSLPSFSVF